jgi:hypothetical protein
MPAKVVRICSLLTSSSVPSSDTRSSCSCSSCGHTYADVAAALSLVKPNARCCRAGSCPSRATSPAVSVSITISRRCSCFSGNTAAKPLALHGASSSCFSCAGRAVAPGSGPPQFHQLLLSSSSVVKCLMSSKGCVESLVKSRMFNSSLESGSCCASRCSSGCVMPGPQQYSYAWPATVQF